MAVPLENLNANVGAAAQRIQLSIAAKEKLRTRLSRPMEDLFSLAAPQSIATAGGISC